MPLPDKGEAKRTIMDTYPSLSISGGAASNVSSGAALGEIERLAAKLPAGYGVEWTGQSFQKHDAGAQAPILVALSFVVVFLVMAALYESWTIPVWCGT